MNGAFEKRSQLKNRIIYENISFDDVEKEVRKLEEEFGEDAFLPYRLKKKDKPWTASYFNELKELSIAGAASKEFILHFAEVKEEIVRRKQQMLCLIAGCASIVVGIIGIIVWLCKR